MARRQPPRPRRDAALQRLPHAGQVAVALRAVRDGPLAEPGKFAASLSRLVPGIEPHDLEPASSGVRAQALHPDGRLADDFEFGRSNDGRVLHVLNAPSPAATASLVIGEQIARELLG